MNIRRWTVGALMAACFLFLAFFYFFGGWNLSAPADFTLCNGDEPQTLDPAIVTGQLEGRICLALFEGLTTRAPDGSIIPGMAQTWEMTPDGLTYTFHLRPGIQWSNGAPVTAQDFVQSWERALNPKTTSEYSYQLYYLVNGEAYGTGKLTDFSQVGVKAPDDHTLVVTLSHPTAFFLELTSFQTLCPVYLPCIQKYGKDWTKPGKMVSNGPYMLKEWRLDDYLMLKANPHYWRPVAINTLKVLPTNSPTACLNLFCSGKTDLILDKTSIPPQLVQDLRSKSYFHSDPYGATAFLRFNVTRKPFTDVRVRQALALALDKKDLVEKITRAGEPVATTLVPPGSPGYAPPAGLPYDVARARKLLADAGYPDGKNFPDVSLLYASRGSTGNIATEIQALWRRDLGITSIHLRGQEWKVYLNTQSEIDFDLDLAAWIGDYNDPKTFLDMFVTNGGNNNTGWSNADYDKLLDSSESITDPKARMQVLEKMEKILVEDELPILPLYYYVGMSLYYPNRLGGYEPNFVDDHRWGNFYIPEKHQTASLLP